MTKSIDSVGVTFVNLVTGRGALNNVVNIQFGTYLFTANEEEQKVEPDLVTSCRLRMDYACAHQLYESLGNLLDGIAKEQEALASGLSAVPAERPN